jgi:alpha-amylase
MKSIKLPLPRRLVIIATCALLAGTPARAAFNPPDTSVQLFEWSWNDIATECTQWLGPQGYGAAQISPPHASKVANGWWGVYQPVNYVNLTSRMGTEAQLQTMINTCHTAGVRVYADIVVNQMADGSGTATDGSTWNANTLAFPFFSALDFHPNCNIDGSDYNSPAGQYNVQHCRLGGLPDLATENSYVQGQIVNYLRKLIDMGVDGFRIDAAKHMQASALQSIFNTLKATRPKTRAGENIWITQEIINDGATNRGEYFPIGTLNEFQFTYAMRDVFRGYNGQALSAIPTIMGTWGNWGGTWGFIQPQNATIFLNNWDTERNGSSLNASNYGTGVQNDTVGTQRYALANVFMLAQGYGEAQVQSGFRFTDTNADRPAASPYSNGVAQINVVWDFIHRWQPVSNMIKLRAAASGQVQTNWTVGNANQVAFSRGTVAFVALNNTGATWSRTFFTNLPAGTYCNVINGGRNAAGNACTGSIVVVDASGNASITVPADGAEVPAVAIYTGQRLSTTSSTSTCAVTFTIANANTTFGEDLYVAGNQTAIDNWTAPAADKLTIQGSGANAQWKGTVNLPAGTATQYKYIKRNGSATVWESNQPTASGNRAFSTCASGTQARSDGSFKF